MIEYVERVVAILSFLIYNVEKYCKRTMVIRTV